MRLSLAFGVFLAAAVLAPAARADTAGEEGIAALEKKIDVMTRAYEARIASATRV